MCCCLKINNPNKKGYNENGRIFYYFPSHVPPWRSGLQEALRRPSQGLVLQGGEPVRPNYSRAHRQTCCYHPQLHTRTLSSPVFHIKSDSIGHQSPLYNNSAYIEGCLFASAYCGWFNQFHFYLWRKSARPSWSAILVLPTRFYPLRGCSAKKCSDKVRQRTIGEKPWAKKSLVNPRRAIESFLHKELFLHHPFSANMDQTLLGPVHFHTNCHTQHSNDSIKPSDMSQFLVYTKCCQLCQNDNSYFNCWTSSICQQSFSRMA